MSREGKNRFACRLLVSGIVANLLTGCDGDRAAKPVAFTAEETRVISKLSPLPAIPGSPTNAFADHPDAVKFGQRLFFDPRFSGNGSVSCATCHDPEQGFSDGRKLSEGIETTDRHSPTLWNVAYQRWFFWDGRADSLWAQSLQPLHDQKEMGAHTTLALEVVLYDSSLREAYESIFGSLDVAAMSSGSSLDQFHSNLGKAFEAYQRTLISTDSPFDRFVAGDKAAISPSAQRGLRLFVGRGQCVLCHAGPNFSDGEFHNIGLPHRPGHPRDIGRFSGIRLLQTDRFNGLGEFSDDTSLETNIKLRYLAQKQNNLGQFKTPTLRHVAETAPYMHDGRFDTLREVFEFYSTLPGEPSYGHREEALLPLNFSEAEKDDLVAFLRTLTGAPLDSHQVRDPNLPAKKISFIGSGQRH